MEKKYHSPSRLKPTLVVQSMLLAFFLTDGNFLHHIVPGSSRISANHIVKVQGTFMKHTSKKMPEMMSQERFFHQGNTLVHTVAIGADMDDSQ